MLDTIVEAAADAAKAIAEASTPDPIARRLAQVKGIHRVQARDRNAHARQIRLATSALRRAQANGDEDGTVAAIIRLRALGVTSASIREAVALAAELSDVTETATEPDAETSQNGQEGPYDAPEARGRRGGRRKAQDA